MEDLKRKIADILAKEAWTDDDREWLSAYLGSGSAEELRMIMENEFHSLAADTAFKKTVLSELLLETIHQKIIVEKPKSIRRIPIRWMIAASAAAIVCFLITGQYWLQHTADSKLVINRPDKKDPAINQVTLKDNGPGNKVILTLADGSSVSLGTDSGRNLLNQGDAHVINKGNLLTYNASATHTSREAVYNILSTPRGNAFQLSLSDGTQVWLNAASSIRYPTVFSEKERKVEITGEVYFEVAKRPDRPFIVTVGNSVIKVLGTHFNVAAYGEETFMTTTLLEGAVQFIHEKKTILLAPGQQSLLSKTGNITVNKSVDMQEVMAWKNGMFHFDGETIKSVMHQLSRWYNIDVIYPDRYPPDLFSADIPRNTSLSDVLKALELTHKVQFRTEGEKVFVN